MYVDRQPLPSIPHHHTDLPTYLPTHLFQHHGHIFAQGLIPGQKILRGSSQAQAVQIYRARLRLGPTETITDLCV